MTKKWTLIIILCSIWCGTEKKRLCFFQSHFSSYNLDTRSRLYLHVNVYFFFHQNTIYSLIMIENNSTDAQPTLLFIFAEHRNKIYGFCFVYYLFDVINRRHAF